MSNCNYCRTSTRLIIFSIFCSSAGEVLSHLMPEIVVISQGVGLPKHQTTFLANIMNQFIQPSVHVFLPLRKCWSFRMNCICWRQQPTVKLLFSEQRDFTMFTSIWHIFSDHTSDHSGQKTSVGYFNRDFTSDQKFSPPPFTLKMLLVRHYYARVDCGQLLVFIATPEVTARTLL